MGKSKQASKKKKPSALGMIQNKRRTFCLDSTLKCQLLGGVMPRKNATILFPTPQKRSFTEEEFIEIQDEFQVQWVMNPVTSELKRLKPQGLNTVTFKVIKEM